MPLELRKNVYTIKIKKLKLLILKMDLKKYYGRLDWTYLKLTLLQIGLPFMMIDWIMVCVSTTIFLVLINGNPSAFFKSSRGLRQGCPLSPILFLLVVEDLSRLIRKAK